MTGSFAFEGFVLDAGQRRLLADDRPIELNGRYLDALALMVRNDGKLVSKDRFLQEVWSGVPVTDEALTQCIKTLRQKLGDDANRPRFIETVPKHGYRFIAPVTVLGTAGNESTGPLGTSPEQWREFIGTLSAGIVGGAAAGIVGGLIYGFAIASQPAEAGPGALSVLLVLVWITLLIAVVGAAGVTAGIATAMFARPGSLVWSVIGGAAGGLLVGAFGKLLGLDAFTLLVGRSPGNITGASEGALLGATVGVATWLALRRGSVPRGAAIGAAFGAAAGILISLLGGRLMLGSLELLAAGFPNSKLRLDQIMRPFATPMLNRFVDPVAAALEAALFTAGVVAAILIARRRSG